MSNGLGLKFNYSDFSPESATLNIFIPKSRNLYVGTPICTEYF